MDQFTMIPIGDWEKGRRNCRRGGQANNRWPTPRSYGCRCFDMRDSRTVASECRRKARFPRLLRRPSVEMFASYVDEKRGR